MPRSGLDYIDKHVFVLNGHLAATDKFLFKGVCGRSYLFRTAVGRHEKGHPTAINFYSIPIPVQKMHRLVGAFETYLRMNINK